MVKLKSYRLKLKKNRMGKRRSGTRDIITGGITALIGVGLLSQTAGIISKI